MTALRLARAFTGRDKVLKFEGCYHGHSDGLLVQAGSGAAHLGQATSAGVTAAQASDTFVAAYNDLRQVEKIFEAEGGRIAAVIVEPVAGNMGLVPPEPGFIEGLRRTTLEHGSLLVFDEVITGFRVVYGGYQDYANVSPDITCLGKIIGGGLPVGAYGRETRGDGNGRASGADVPGGDALRQPHSGGGGHSHPEGAPGTRRCTGRCRP